MEIGQLHRLMFIQFLYIHSHFMFVYLFVLFLVLADFGQEET